MNDITKIPAAELVGEYTEIEKSMASAIKLRYAMAKEKHERRDLIAQELDQRCEAAGIYIAEGGVRIDWRSGDAVRFGMSQTFYGMTKAIPASEFRAMLGWLLMKDGK